MLTRPAVNLSHILKPSAIPADYKLRELQSNKQTRKALKKALRKLEKARKSKSLAELTFLLTQAQFACKKSRNLASMFIH